MRNKDKNYLKTRHSTHMGKRAKYIRDPAAVPVEKRNQVDCTKMSPRSVPSMDELLSEYLQRVSTPIPKSAQTVLSFCLRNDPWRLQAEVLGREIRGVLQTEPELASEIDLYIEALAPCRMARHSLEKSGSTLTDCAHGIVGLNGSHRAQNGTQIRGQNGARGWKKAKSQSGHGCGSGSSSGEGQQTSTTPATETSDSDSFGCSERNDSHNGSDEGSDEGEESSRGDSLSLGVQRCSPLEMLRLFISFAINQIHTICHLVDVQNGYALEEEDRKIDALLNACASSWCMFSKMNV